MILVRSDVRIWLATGYTDAPAAQRQRDRYARDGIDLSLSTLAD